MKFKIVDNFYTKPNVMRELAMKTAYEDVSKMNYPGIQSKLSFTSRSLEKKFEDILDEKLVIDPKRATFGKFRVMMNEKYIFKAHVDGLTYYTALIYMNRAADCHGGTAFYRHRESGLEGPLPLSEVKRRGFKDNEEMFEKLIGDDKFDPAKWEMTDFVEMKFNRLVVFEGFNYFHTHTSSFGTCKETGRLTQLFFFNKNKIQ